MNIITAVQIFRYLILLNAFSFNLTNAVGIQVGNTFFVYGRKLINIFIWIVEIIFWVRVHILKVV